MQPGKLIRMTGALGPLQEGGVAGSMSWKLTAVPAGTRVELSYAAGGHWPGGFEKLAPLVDSVLGEQLRRFAAAASSAAPKP